MKITKTEVCSKEGEISTMKEKVLNQEKTLDRIEKSATDNFIKIDERITKIIEKMDEIKDIMATKFVTKEEFTKEMKDINDKYIDMRKGISAPILLAVSTIIQTTIAIFITKLIK